MNNNIDSNDDGRAFVFYPSFDRSLRHLPPEVRLEVYDAMSRYGCYGEVADDMSPMAMAIFELVKPTIDASITRYEGAGRGGAPKGSRNNPAGRRGKRQDVAPKAPEDSQDNDTELTEELIETNSELTQELTETNSELTYADQELTETNSETNPELTSQKITNKIKDKRIKIKDKRINNCSRNYARAREEFLEDFFTESRQQAIACQAETLGITVEEYRQLVEQVLNDWEVNGPIPAPDNELRSRMLCTVRKKFYAQEQAERRRAATAGAKSSPPTPHNSAYYERIERDRQQRAEMYSTEKPSPEAIAAKIAKFKQEMAERAAPANGDPEQLAIADARALSTNQQSTLT